MVVFRPNIELVVANQVCTLLINQAPCQAAFPEPEAPKIKTPRPPISTQLACSLSVMCHLTRQGKGEISANTVGPIGRRHIATMHAGNLA